MDERGVGPRVLKRGGEVEVTLEDDEDGARRWPAEPVGVREHGPARRHVVPQLLLQLLCDHLRGATARASDDGHPPQGGAHREQSFHDVAHRVFDVGILCGRIVERDVRIALRQ